MSRGKVCTAVVVVVSVWVAGLGCSRNDVATRTPISPGTPNVVSIDGGRVVVEIPGDALDGPGELVVEPVVDAGIEGWSIEVAGARLTGAATLRFPIPELLRSCPRIHGP